MPVHRSSDRHGSFYQWGSHGKKYYYIPNNTASRLYSKDLAAKQGIAIHVRKKNK